MISPEKIEEVAQRLVKAYDPLAIYVFGSYAWGHPDDDSDLDILIVVSQSEEKKHTRSLAGYRSLRGMQIAKDILVFTKNEFDAWLKDESSLCFKVKNKGKVLYARA